MKPEATSTEHAHTPGPWRIRASGAGFDVASEDGGLHIRCVSLDGNGMIDARLIAAAPDLFDATRRCLGVLSGEDMTKQALIDALSVARAAILKAEGK